IAIYVCCIRDCFPRLTIRMFELLEQEHETRHIPISLVAPSLIGCSIAAAQGGILPFLTVLVLVGIGWVDSQTMLIPDSLRWAGSLFSRGYVLQLRSRRLLGLVYPILTSSLCAGCGWLYGRVERASSLGIGDIKTLAWISVILQ